MSEMTKITVKIWEKQLLDFNMKIDGLPIKRDAFIEHILKKEIDLLAADMDGKRLSPKARKYISGELKRLGTVPVNIVVEKRTAERLDEVVRASNTNMVRDAFFNRLILFLRSSDHLLKFLDLPVHITDTAFKSLVQPMPTGPLQAIREVFDDPLFYLRIACKERHKTGLYLTPLPCELNGLACYLEDSMVPGTDANAELQEAFNELTSFESEVFSKRTG